MTFAEVMQEKRATYRSLFTLLRLHDSTGEDWYAEALNALENSMEQACVLLESAVAALSDTTARDIIDRRVNDIMEAADTPKASLRLVKDVYEGESVA